MRSIALVLLASLCIPTVQGATYTPEQIRAVVRQAGGPERFLTIVASNTAKMSGRMIDDRTELFAATSLEKTIVYYVRIVTHNKADVPDISRLRKEIAERNAPSICTAPTTSILINEFGADYKSIVYSKSCEHLFEYSFNRTSCSAGYKW